MRLSAGTLERRFSVERVYLLLRNRIYDEAPVVGVGAALVLGVNALSLVFGKTAFYNSPGRGWAGAWVLTLVVAGLLIAGNALKAMHDGRSEADWLLLPATPAEKYAAALADSVLVFPLGGAALSIALSGILALVEALIGGPGNPAWLPGLDALKAWGGYAVGATVFIAGSATFRKTAFLKTAGIAIAFSILWSLAMALMIMLFVPGAWGGGFSIRNGAFSAGDDSVISARAIDAMRAVMNVVLYAGASAFAILFGYAKVAEKEAKDEVQ
jgi:hypothetical protein